MVRRPGDNCFRDCWSEPVAVHHRSGSRCVSEISEAVAYRCKDLFLFARRVAKQRLCLTTFCTPETEIISGQDRADNAEILLHDAIGARGRHALPDTRPALKTAKHLISVQRFRVFSECTRGAQNLKRCNPFAVLFSFAAESPLTNWSSMRAFLLCCLALALFAGCTGAFAPEPLFDSFFQLTSQPAIRMATATA